jgi:hypothetical protein
MGQAPKSAGSKHDDSSSRDDLPLPGVPSLDGTRLGAYSARLVVDFGADDVKI